jgi:hypothetical protein
MVYKENSLLIMKNSSFPIYAISIKSKTIAFRIRELLNTTSNYFLLYVLILSSFSVAVINGMIPFRGVFKLCVAQESIFSLN